MPAAMIGNIIASYIRNSPRSLEVAIGNVLGKRLLIEVLCILCVSCFYDEILMFKSSAGSRDSKMTGLIAPIDGIVQVVVVNFYPCISSKNVLLNTHSLAKLQFQIPMIKSIESGDKLPLF